MSPIRPRDVTSVAGVAISLVVAIEVILHLHRTYRLRKQRVYPPGPKPRFLIGNLLDLPTTNAAEVYMEWGKKYNSAGPWLHLSLQLTRRRRFAVCIDIWHPCPYHEQRRGC